MGMGRGSCRLDWIGDFSFGGGGGGGKEMKIDLSWKRGKNRLLTHLISLYTLHIHTLTHSYLPIRYPSQPISFHLSTRPIPSHSFIHSFILPFFSSLPAYTYSAMASMRM